MPKKLKKEVKRSSISLNRELKKELENLHIPTQKPHHIHAYSNLTDSSTGIKYLDEILDGGFPKGSTILLAGSSGSGKTIFSLQWMFYGIKRGENAIYLSFTEPIFKILANLEKHSFYDRSAIEGEKLKLLDIRNSCCNEKFDQTKILKYIEEEIKKSNAKRLCIDSITAIAYSLNDKAKIREFIFELGKLLSTLGCTSILTSEISDPTKYSVFNVEEFISDGIIKLDQEKKQGKIVRIMNLVKIRGKSYDEKTLYFKITTNGIVMISQKDVVLNYNSTEKRISIGNDKLDKILHGGLYIGSSTLAMGSAGTGKTSLCMQFIYEGLKNGEPGLYCSFEESEEQIIKNAKLFGLDFKKYLKNGMLTIRCIYLADKFLEEHLLDIEKIVENKNIKRCVLDSLSALMHNNSDDKCLNFSRRLVGYLKSENTTHIIVMISPSAIEMTNLVQNSLMSLTDNVIALRHVEMQGQLNQVLNVVKARGSSHNKGLIKYDITNKGIILKHSLSGYEGVLTGVTRKVSDSIEEKLKSIFEKFIGPIAASEFQKLCNDGLTKENLSKYIEELESEKILRQDIATIFKKEINAIMES